MSEEKKRILGLVRDGKVTVDEGLKLLEALDSSADEGSGTSWQSGGSPGKMLRVRVFDMKTTLGQRYAAALQSGNEVHSQGRNQAAGR